jgi:PAS domain S-box-containing protein
VALFAKETVRKLTVRFKLTHTLILLIVIPLAFELMFVSTLVYSLKQADDDYAREAKSREMVVLVNNVLTYFLTAVSGMAMHMSNWNLPPRAAFRDETQDALQNLERIHEQLQRMIPSDKEMAPELTVYEALIGKCLQFARQQAIDVDSNNPLRYAGTINRARSLLNMMNDQAGKVLQHAGEIREKQHVLASQNREKIQYVIIGGVCLNVALAIILGLYFPRDIANRLAILMKNNYRLAAEEPLEPKIGGNDEFADIDHTFHLMASILQEARHKEKAIIENAHDVICSLDRKGKFVSSNSAAREIWGYSPDELIGRSVNALAVGGDGADLIKSISEFSSAQSSGMFEAAIKKKDGSVAEMRWSVRWSAAENSMFCVVHDITERKEVERMKQNFLSMVSHDMRSPLSAVQLALNMIAEGIFGPINERGALMVSNAENSVNRLLKMINELLDLDRLEAGRFDLDLKPCSIDEVIQNSIDTIENFANQRKVRISFVKSGIKLKADDERLVQVVINILTNAIKFSPDGTTVSVAAAEQKDVVEISIADEGRGIPEENLGAIFDRFKQVELKDSRQHKGSGLGLAICKAIVEAHGGRIAVRSAVGKGSTFIVSLPKAPQPG